MNKKRVVKALLVVAVAFCLVMIALSFINPNSNLRKFILNEPKDETVSSAYDIGNYKSESKNPIKNNNSLKAEEDIYENQILDKNDYSSEVDGLYCKECSGKGEKNCSACFTTGVDTNGGVCRVCYGDGVTPCDKCSNGIIY